MRGVAMKFVGLALFALCGCGGSGGGPVVPVATFSATGPGDTWNYAVNIDFGVFGKFAGTLTEALTNDTYNGNPSVRFTRTFNLQITSGPAILTSFEEISPAGRLLAESVNGSPVAVTQDTFSTPSTLSQTTSTSGEISLDNGESFSSTYRVVGVARTQTGAGTFACWLVNQNVTHSDTTTDAYTMWIAPETGNYVRVKDTTVNPDGTGYTYIAVLTSHVSSGIALTRDGSLRAGIRGAVIPPPVLPFVLRKPQLLISAAR